MRKVQEAAMKKFGLFAQIGDTFGTVGAIVATMGCAMCFPALASIGAAIGLGFLAQWEGLLITTLPPLFAWIALCLHTDSSIAVSSALSAPPLSCSVVTHGSNIAGAAGLCTVDCC